MALMVGGVRILGETKVFQMIWISRWFKGASPLWALFALICMNFSNRVKYWDTMGGTGKDLIRTSFNRAMRDWTWYWRETAQKLKYALIHSSESLSCF